MSKNHETRESYIHQLIESARPVVNEAARTVFGKEATVLPARVQPSVSPCADDNEMTDVRWSDCGKVLDLTLHAGATGGRGLVGLVLRMLLQAVMLRNGKVKSDGTPGKGAEWTKLCKAAGLANRPGKRITPVLNASGELLVAKAGNRTGYGDACWPVGDAAKMADRWIREAGAYPHAATSGKAGTLMAESNKARPGAKRAPDQDCETRPKREGKSGTGAVTVFAQDPESPFAERGARIYKGKDGMPQGTVACVATLLALGVDPDIVKRATLVQRVKGGSAVKGDDAKPVTAKGRVKNVKRQHMPEPDLHKPMADGPTDADLDAIENEAPKLAAVS